MLQFIGSQRVGHDLLTEHRNECMYVKVKPFAEKAKILSELSVYSGEIRL